MGIILNKDDTRTKLQKRVAEDLAEKQRNKARELTQDRPDGVDDSAYLENTKQTTSLAWVWALVVIALIAAVVWVVVASF